MAQTDRDVFDKVGQYNLDEIELFRTDLLKIPYQEE